jgi:hypothetical protein
MGKYSRLLKAGTITPHIRSEAIIAHTSMSTTTKDFDDAVTYDEGNLSLISPSIDGISRIVSAPGKVLLTGGYLVTQRPNKGNPMFPKKTT